MIGKEIVDSEIITGATVKSILEDFAEDNELTYEQNLTYNHLARFESYSVEDAEEIYQRLREELGLRDKVAVHIVNLIPKDLADLRLIFAKEPTKTDKKDMEEILKLLDEYSIEE